MLALLELRGVGSRRRECKKKIKSANLSTHCLIDCMKKYTIINTFIQDVIQQVKNRQLY